MAKAKIDVSMIKVGSRVSWKSGGKIARLEGMSGKIVTGTVTAVRNDGLSVTPDHRVPKTASFHGMGASVDFDQVLSVA